MTKHFKDVSFHPHIISLFYTPCSARQCCLSLPECMCLYGTLELFSIFEPLFEFSRIKTINYGIDEGA